jgi:hypothetical protein
VLPEFIISVVYQDENYILDNFKEDAEIMTEQEVKDLEKKRRRELKDYVERCNEAESQEEFEEGEWNEDDDMMEVAFVSEDLYFTTKLPIEIDIDVNRVFVIYCLL